MRTWMYRKCSVVDWQFIFSYHNIITSLSLTTTSRQKNIKTMLSLTTPTPHHPEFYLFYPNSNCNLRVVATERPRSDYLMLANQIRHRSYIFHSIQIPVGSAGAENKWDKYWAPDNFTTRLDTQTSTPMVPTSLWTYLCWRRTFWKDDESFEKIDSANSTRVRGKKCINSYFRCAIYRRK